jgi:ABC-type multidrug transport system fused ATPase/permease subunit
MSTDIERVTAGMENMHDFCADVLQVGLGCWLLQRKLDSAFLAPMVVVLCCGLIMVWLGRASAKTQASWIVKIQSRVGMTSKVITHVKQVKISGIAPTIEELVQKLHVNELLVGNKYHIVLVLTSRVSFAPQSLSAVLAFALAGSSLDVTATYESLAYLVLLTAPLSSFFQRIPNVLSAITCLTRIQEYLESEPRRDFRVASNEQTIRRLSSVSSFSSRMRSATASKLEQIDTTDARALSIEAALSNSNGTFGWKAGQTVLTDISISLPISHLTFVIGPVASGKSTICKAILGDIPIAAGEVRLDPSISSVAFCDQVPFLISGALHQNIVGHLAFDHARFNEVVCAASILESSAEQIDSSVDVTKDVSSTLRTAPSRTEDAITKAQDDRSRQLGDRKVYRHYINSMNKIWLLLMITRCVIFAIGEHLPTVWVGLWAKDSLNQSRSFYLGIYGAVSSMIVIGVSVVAWTSFVPMTFDVGRELHRRALWTVMHAPLRLFTTTDTGTITNLFSQDSTTIDSELLLYFLNVVANTATVIGSGLVIALSSPYFAVSYPFLIAVGYCIQMFYLRTSRQLCLLDLEAKSPL